MKQFLAVIHMKDGRNIKGIFTEHLLHMEENNGNKILILKYMGSV
jgi:hypothetical protein